MNSGPETTKITPLERYRWFFLLASALFVPLVVLGIVEVCLRIADVGYRSELLVPCTVQGSPASCYNLFFAATFFPAGMVQTPRLYAIPAKKPPRTFRIFVLGESAAMGDPDPAYGFSRYLEVMLRERFPSTKFEVVNTGSVAINSHVLLPIAKGLADQRPDLFRRSRYCWASRALSLPWARRATSWKDLRASSFFPESKSSTPT